MLIGFHSLAFNGNTEGILQLSKMTNITNGICVEAPQKIVSKMRGKIRGSSITNTAIPSPVHAIMNMSEIKLEVAEDEKDTMETANMEIEEDIVEE